MSIIKPGKGQRDLFDKKFNTFVLSVNELAEEPSMSNELLQGNDIAACYAVANACKRAIKRSGFSRDHFVDKINTYWGRTAEGVEADPPECLPLLTISMFNNYLSKPSKYRLPAIYIIAIEAIAGNLEITRLLADAQGGQVINGDEARQLKLAQVQRKMQELAQHEKELKRLAGF